MDVVDTVYFREYTMSFGVSVSTFEPIVARSRRARIVNNLDDIVISRHGYKTPLILMNRSGVFEDKSDLISGYLDGDLHGIFFGDVDGDGFRDLLIAGGGADGVGEGRGNILLLNTGESGVDPTFTEVTSAVNLGAPTLRSRHFVPLPSSDGSHIDFFLSTKPRTGTTRVFFKNESKGLPDIHPDKSRRVSSSLNLEGRSDCFVDIDADGDLDLLVLHEDKLLVYERKKDSFKAVEQDWASIVGPPLNPKKLLPLIKLGKVTYFQVADINNDGLFDLYIGRRPTNPAGDHLEQGIIGGSRVVQFYFERQSGDDGEDGFSFVSNANSISIDFLHKRGLSANDASPVNIGRENTHPVSLVTVINADNAEGFTPNGPGVYIFNEKLTGGKRRWHVRYSYPVGALVPCGRVYIPQFSELEQKSLEIRETPSVNDFVLLNKGAKDGNIRFLSLPVDVEHNQVTRAGVWFDFNNDGYLDFVGMRGSFTGDINGDNFILVNRGMDSDGIPTFLPQGAGYINNTYDDLGQADCIAVGFFNADGLPDLVTTSGWGLNPGNLGPLAIYYNTTDDSNSWVLLELIGTVSNTEALGATVRLVTREGEPLSGLSMVGLNYNRMQNTHKLHFGLGSYRDAVYAQIRWPSGLEQKVRVHPKKLNFIVEED